jgi:hypothetical protein
MSGPSVTVVGGGLAGLVAAIECAERGAAVELHEAHASLGGRARTSAGPYRANFGPHALYKGRENWRWLAERGLLPRTARPDALGVRYRLDGELGRTPPLGAVRAFLHLRLEAPVDRDFRGWASERFGERAAAALCGWAGPFSFHHDPGSLSAAFVWDRLRWIYAPPTVRYVVGGWSELTDRLAARARELGVRIELGSRVDRLPDPFAIIATELTDACTLLGDPTLRADGADALLLDVAVTASRRDPFAVLDLDEGMLAERYPGSAPQGQELIQASRGVPPGADPDEQLARLEQLLDLVFPTWRDREVWRRRQRSDQRTGAVDLPGHTWRDRPAIDRDNGIFLAGDAVAAPGLLSETSFTSARKAVEMALG